MRDFAGAPGTKVGMLLRLLQSALAILSIKLVIFTSTDDLNYYTYSCYMTCMLAQLTWSASLALMDAYAVITSRKLYSRITVGFIAAGDWVTGFMSLAAACFLAAITALYNPKETGCQFKHRCDLYELSAGFAFFSWMATTTSSLLLFYVAAGGD